MKKSIITGLACLLAGTQLSVAQCDPRYGGATFQLGPYKDSYNSTPTPTIGVGQSVYLRFNFGAGSPALTSPPCNNSYTGSNYSYAIQGWNKPGMITLSIAFPNSYYPQSSADVWGTLMTSRFSWTWDPVGRVMIGVNNVEIPIIAETFFIKVTGMVVTPGPAVDICNLNWTSETNPPMNNNTVANDVVSTGLNIDPLPVILPVHFLSFNGTVSDCNSVNLVWATAQEINALSYLIERAPVGTSDFLAVGNVAAVGNAAIISNYTYTDRVSKQGTYLYRLKQVDKDGKFTYSEILSLKINCNAKGMPLVYPNPVKDKEMLTVALPAGNENFVVEVYSALGQKMKSFTAAGGSINKIDTYAWSSGPYEVVILSGNNMEKVLSTKIVKQ